MGTSQGKPPLVIGLTGPLGSGVTFISRILESENFVRVSLSDGIKEELKTREHLTELQPIGSVADWRKKLQDIGNEKRLETPTYWLDKALNGIHLGKDIVIDGLRNLGEIQGLREKYTNSFVIGVVATKDTRWQRVQDVYDKNLKNFDRDDIRDSDEDIPNGQQVQKCVLDADYVLINETIGGSSDVREKKLRDRLIPEIQLMRKTPGRVATQDEAHMATAYAQSHLSKCLKRHVGAVIVDGKGIPMSLGYNENPVGTLPCVSAYGYCYKDENMHVKLEHMQAHCPRCGDQKNGITKPWKCQKCGDSLKLSLFQSRNMEVCTAIHAEDRAIRSLAGRNAEGAVLYATTFPCFQCARHIIDVGISKLVYVEPYPVRESYEFLTKSNVNVEPFQGFMARCFHLVFRQVGE
jgi:deoxycytidylate deaminase/dephospho-CoA kinase